MRLRGGSRESLFSTPSGALTFRLPLARACIAASPSEERHNTCPSHAIAPPLLHAAQTALDQRSVSTPQRVDVASFTSAVTRPLLCVD
ncbi:hypothetical protein SKAU_G00403500 [Synaphobranchus kaupii]|uniref:Uncharacterized protein n=1 Tax=Synaphobranchus kaupii TaxID=118154 RepID=A0A9Q1ICL9_SYNKA|nr:hypothetical protein SKAU_G00403500 [Synaphobranchus kaupii]